MDRKSINKNASLVWCTLNDCREWSYNDLKEATGLSDRDLNTAIGWLAHENKISFEHKCGQEFISLGFNVYIG